MLKGKKMDFLVQKMTELGVHTFVPVITRYCEKRVQEKRLLARWQRIMLEACKQCRRPVPMQIQLPVTYSGLEIPADSSRIIAWEGENRRSFQPSPTLTSGPPVILLIGPEGGFHPSEVATALDNGFTSISLGPRILRAETAALAAVTLIQHACHNLDPVVHH
jgi:16S rRNA (uracil1498-N3)-methyltransferase